MKLVVIGSITEDIIISPDKRESRFIGGVPVYAAATAKAFEETIGIVAKVGTDFHLANLKLLHSLGADLRGFSIAGTSSMRFENRYDSSGKRTQKLLSQSQQLTFTDIPKSYYSVPCIHLGPVFDEISVRLLAEVREHFSLISLDAQGFARSVEDKNSRIILKPRVELQTILPYLDILKVDDQELKCLTTTTRLADAITVALASDLKLLIITRAHKGAIIFHNKQRIDIPAFPTTIVDETGAGDTFITAFLLDFLTTDNVYHAGLIAAAAAAFKISSSGPIPTYTRSDVLQKVQTFLAS